MPGRLVAVRLECNPLRGKAGEPLAVLASTGRIGRPNLIHTLSWHRRLGIASQKPGRKYRWAVGPIVSTTLESGAVAVRYLRYLRCLDSEVVAPMST